MTSFADLVHSSFRLHQEVATQGHKSEPGRHPLDQCTTSATTDLVHAWVVLAPSDVFNRQVLNQR